MYLKTCVLLFENMYGNTYGWKKCIEICIILFKNWKYVIEWVYQMGLILLTAMGSTQFLFNNCINIPKYLSLFLGITTKQPIYESINCHYWRKQKNVWFVLTKKKKKVFVNSECKFSNTCANILHISSLELVKL